MARTIETSAVDGFTAGATVAAATVVALVACAGAPRVVPLLDAVDALIEPMMRHGANYLLGTPERTFFRPLEYYVNFETYRLGSMWLSLTVVVAAVGAMGAVLARLAHPDQAHGLRWRLMTVALIMAHPIILASEYEYDRVSQALANLLGALALYCAVRRPLAIGILLALDVLGLAAKESFATFMLLSSAWSAAVLWRRREHGRLGLLVLGSAVLLIAYRWVHVHTTNEPLLAATPRYQLSVGFNALRNFALFVGGTTFFGSTARAAERLADWDVVAWSLASAGVWGIWVAFAVRSVRCAKDRLQWARDLAPLLLGMAAALVPSVLMQDVSENNASCFAAFFLATTLALVRRATDWRAYPRKPEAAVRQPKQLLAVSLVAAALCCASGSLDKLQRVRATSADAIAMAAQARAHAGEGLIHIDCSYAPRRRYSIYHMPSAVLVGSINRLLIARNELAASDVVECASPGGS